MPDIDVRVPDGRLIRIQGAESDEAARAAVQSMLQDERRTGPHTGSSVARGVDELQGSLYSAAEGAGRATGLNWLEQFGRAGRERNAREAEISQPEAQRQTFEDASTAGDYARAAGQAIGSNVPQMGLSAAGALAGGAAGAMLGPVGAGAGALVGMFAPNYAQLFGANRQRQMQENPNQPVNEGAAAITAIPQAALDTVSDRVLLGLGRFLGRPAEEVGRTLVPRIARGLGIGAATEVPTEVMQQALERAQAGLDLLSPEAMREYRETAIASGVTGGAMGGAFSGVRGARPNQQIEPTPETQAEPQAPVPAAESLLPLTPIPFEDPAEARRFLSSNREFAPRFDVTDDEATVLANRYQALAHEQEVDALRNNEIGRFLGTDRVREINGTQDRGVQADQLLQRLTQAAADPNQTLDIGNFQPIDVANIALQRLGPEAEGPTSREIGAVRRQLNALQQAGFLTRGAERGTFAIAPRPVEQLRQMAAERTRQAEQPTRADRIPSEADATERQLAFPGLTELAQEAGPTAQQQAAQQALTTIADPAFGQAPISDRTAAIEQIAQTDPRVGELLTDYASSLDRHAALQQALQANPALAQVPEVQQASQQLAAERARVADELTGLQNLSAIAEPGAQPMVAPAPTRGPGGFPGDLRPDTAPQLLRATRARQAAAEATPAPATVPTETPEATGFMRAAGERAPQTALDLDVARQAGEQAFRRVLGANGRLEMRDRLFLRDLGETVQAAAADAGIADQEIDGVAMGDLAVLALRDTTTPITDVAIHEGYHVAENLGLFTPNELALLNSNLDKIREVIKQTNPGISDMDLANPAEVRAYGLNARVAQRADFGSMLNSIMDKLVNFLERIGSFVRGQGFQTWRDVYDAFNEGGMAGRTPTNQANNPTVEFMARQLPADTTKASALVKQEADQITGALKWFGSPIMTMGKVKPALRPASDTMRQLYTRTQEATVALEELLAPAARLDGPARARVTRAWEAASRSKKAPNYAAMSAEEAQALRSLIGSGQRALDFMVESYAHSYFQPDASKTPQERARLEAFWAKHHDQHLWEIPARELAAASPEGWREMQRFERMRNPYYMPMMARGTHFVAAYERRGSSEKLVRMVAYSPLNMAQRMRGFADPEAAAKAELRRQYPKARITERGTQFSNDANASKVRDQGDFVAQYLDQLSRVSNQQGQKIIGQMQNQIDKAQMERLFRPNQDILQAVTPTNEQSYILDAVPQYMLSTAKIQARRYTQDNWKNALAPLTQNDQTFLNNLRDYATTPTEAFGTARALSFFMYLGGAIDTALINMTQMLQTTLPHLMRDGGAAGSQHFLSAARDVGFGDLTKVLNGDQSFTESVIARALKNPVEAAAVVKAREQGIFNPVYANESRGQFTAETMSKVGVKNAARAADAANKITSLAGRFMQAVEETNRLVTFLGAFRLATANPEAIAYANRADNTNWQTPYDYAMGKVIDTQFLTTKEDRAYVQRFHPIAEVVTQFGSFPLKMTELYVRAASTMLQGIQKSDPFMAKAGGVLLLGMTAPLIGMAGIWGLPGADKARELLEVIVGKIWGSTQNFDMDTRELLGGGRMAEAIVRGVPHAYDMMSLSRRLAIDPSPVKDLTGNITGLLGPTGGLAEAYLRRFPQYIANGDYWNAAAVLMPRAVGNVIRGAALAETGEQRTLRGNRVVTPQDVERVDSRSWVPASVRQAIGFPPPEFSNMREIVAMGEEVSRQVRDASERVNKELAGYLTQAMEARREGDSARVASLTQTYGQRMREVLQEQDTRPIDRRINLNQAAITRRATDDFYGISSEQVLGRRAPRNTRPEIARQRQILDWRSQPGQGYAEGGLVAPGNIDLKNRPQHWNADGSVSTVRSMSIGTDDGEVLIPTIRQDGYAMSPDEAELEYRRSGRHLGIFRTPEEATAYAERLHKMQAQSVRPAN